MADRILRLTEDGTEVAEPPAETSAGALDAGRVVVLGPQGVLDASVLGGALFYVHTQGTPSDTWNIVHNLGRHPSVAVVDSAGEQWLVTPRHLSLNECVLEMRVSFSGTATCS